MAGSSLNFEHRKIYTPLEPFLPVRYFNWKDLPDLLEFASLVQSSGAPQDREIARRNFREVLEQPWLEPEKNCLLLEVEGQIRGYCLIIAELPIKRAVLAPDIAGDLAGSREEAELLDQAVARAWELGTVVAHLCLAQDSPRRHLLESKGFTLERVYGTCFGTPNGCHKPWCLPDSELALFSPAMPPL